MHILLLAAVVELSISFSLKYYLLKDSATNHPTILCAHCIYIYIYMLWLCDTELTGFSLAEML